MLDPATRKLVAELARHVLRFRARVIGAAVLLILAKVAAVAVPLVLKAIVDVLSRPEALAALPVLLLFGQPVFMRYLMMASGDKIFAEGGGQQIRDKNGEVIGAVGVTGDTEDRDEELAAHGIHAVGLKTDEDCKDMGRKFRQRLTSAADGR